ncbi:hypothetical protein KOY48_04360 [Candidatus Minimicrobia naudis]|uniref:Uncharacterized protein n=1 Tax=Candidatus Minimicrobia naudis TaxID=2841263 RepID=A0A8F1MCL9_9BACT|nr:hypothetical protein KOY48_04360 [Candidatus Minimicrobia naudis]
MRKLLELKFFEEDKTTLSNSDMAVDGANMVMKIDRASMVILYFTAKNLSFAHTLRRLAGY